MEKINIYGNFVHIVYFNKYDGVYVMFFIWLAKKNDNVAEFAFCEENNAL